MRTRALELAPDNKGRNQRSKDRLHHEGPARLRRNQKENATFTTGVTKHALSKAEGSTKEKIDSLEIRGIIGCPIFARIK